MTAFAISMLVIGLIAGRIAAYRYEAWRAECDAHTASYFRRLEWAQRLRRITHGRRA